ncbi:MAG: 2-dehydropantoate 2-reductase N-terminal domain-containing protein [Finegoldia sp.]|nr:2-dehydropantoate 2-reductase N-terminal domain-containing protein [Finegoldia sp.]
MKILVIGAGRWGSFIAWYLCKVGHDVSLYGREDSEKFKEIKEKRENGMIVLQDNLKLTSNLREALEADVIHVGVSAQKFRDVCKDLKDLGISDKIICLNMKGIEISTGKRLTEVAEEILDPSNKLAVWLGPGHPQEFFKGNPNCMVIDSVDFEVKDKLIKEYTSKLIRFYYGEDVIGNEIGAAYKNVIGIVAGMLDGANLTSLKGALMSRGCREVSRLIEAFGGKAITAYGLSHLGDYEATLFSKLSNNRNFGESYIRGEKFEKLAEGYYTCEAIEKIAVKMNLDLPVNHFLYEVLYKGSDPKKELDRLLNRSLKSEFY